jgi:hypothetical protein
LSILSLSCSVARVLLRKALPIPITSRVFPALSCTSCKILGLILKSLIYFEFTLVHSDRHGSSFSILQADNHFWNCQKYPCSTFVEQAVFSPSQVFGTFVKNKVGMAVWIHIWVLCSVPLVFMSVLVPVPCCFYCYYSIVYFEVGFCSVLPWLFAVICVFKWTLG